MQINKFLLEAIVGIIGGVGAYMMTKKPVFGVVGAIASVLTVSAVKALLVKAKYSDICGALPTEGGSYCENWWACAFGAAVDRGICRTDAAWWIWMANDVPNDIEATEGIYSYSCYSGEQDFEDPEHYVRILAYPSGTLIGRYKWKC